MTAYSAKGLELGVRDISALAANFYKADASVQAVFRSLAEQYADEIAQLASFLSPYDKGFMSAHVVKRFTPSGLGFEVGWVAADFFAAGLPFYPVFQEFGTRYMAAQPSLGPAYEDVRPRYVEAVREALTDALIHSFGG